MTLLTKRFLAAVAVGAFVLSTVPSGALALEWPDAPEPSGSGDVMWAEIYQTPESASFGMITSYACGPKSQYGRSGTTGGQNLGGGDRLGSRYIYFANACNVSQAQSNRAFDKSSYVFTLENGYTRYAGALVAPPTTTTTSTTTTTTSTTSTTTTTIPPTTTSTSPSSSGKKNTTTTSVQASNPSPVNGNLTDTTIAAVQDDGQSDDDFADIGISSRSGKFDLRVSSSFPDTQMLLRAVKKGSKSVTWNLVSNGGGSYRIITSRSLKGFTLTLWIDGEKWDSIAVR
jgi:hypothetical protein